MVGFLFTCARQGELQLDLAAFMQLVLKAGTEAGVPHDGRPQALHPVASANPHFVPLEEKLGTQDWLGPIGAESAAMCPPPVSGPAHASMLGALSSVEFSFTLPV